MQPSSQFLSGVTPNNVSWIQHRLLEEVRSGRPGSDDPGNFLAGVKPNLDGKANDDIARELLGRLNAQPDEAMELALHDIEHEKLSHRGEAAAQGADGDVLSSPPDRVNAVPIGVVRPPSVELTTSWGVEPTISGVCGAGERALRDQGIGRRCPTGPGWRFQIRRSAGENLILRSKRSADMARLYQE